jgi:predicted acetyltransferase
MQQWLSSEYEATLFEQEGETLGYALFRHDAEWVYLRQFFVCRSWRRRGVGRRAIEWLKQNVCHGERLRIDVLVDNTTAIAFWRSVGFVDYCLTMESESDA